MTIGQVPAHTCEIIDKQKNIGKPFEKKMDNFIEKLDTANMSRPCEDFENKSYSTPDEFSLDQLFGESREICQIGPVTRNGGVKPCDAEDVSIIIDRVRAASIKVPLVVNGIESKAVIDTGAEVTVLNETLYSQIPESKRPKLKKATRKLVVAEAGKQMATRGIAEVEMKLGNEIFTWPVYVAPIGDSILLGCDVIDEKDITINSKRGLQLGGQWINCETNRRTDGIARVRIKEALTIPGNSEIVISGKGENREDISTQFSVLEPTVEDKRKVMVARSLVDSSGESIPVRLINLDDRPIKLRKNYLLGELHAIDEITDVTGIEDQGTKSRYAIPAEKCKTHGTIHQQVGQNHVDDQDFKIPEEWLDSLVIKQISSANDDGKPTNKADILELPEYLQDLYDRSIKNLTSESDKLKLKKLLVSNKDAFAANKTDLGTCSIIKHKIDTGASAPIRQPLRRTPLGYEKEEEKYLKDQIDQGVVQPSTSPWASNVVLVRKRDQTVRWCLDYRLLNEITIKAANPLPRIDMCIDCLASASIFSSLDLQSGYWQLKVEESDRIKTAFITKYGLFEYTKMPFGLCNAPATFQRCMELIFRGLQWQTILIYLDDIIIFSSDIDEHFHHLQEVLKRLKNAGLKLKPSKCDLIKGEILYLGHIVGKDGVKPNPRIVEAVKTWKVPTTVKEVQQYLGLCNYYRQFIRGFSEVAAPLSHLTRKEVAFTWTDEARTSFDKLKEALCTAPILAYPKPEGQFVLDTDASNIGIGGVLHQIQDGKEKVVAYASKKLDKSQQRYSVTRRELLAMVTFIHQFRHYLLGRKFSLRTDHAALKWLYNFKDPQGQLARWIESLAQYDFDICIRAGMKHNNADAMSRKDYDEKVCIHQQDEKIDQNCLYCQKLTNQWKGFKSEIDNIKNLSDREQNHTKTRIRVVTRQQDKAMTSHNWLSKYNNAEVSTFQLEDTDVGILHKWYDTGTIPDRDEVSGMNPAVRRYWLNWSNITRLNGVLYQKLIIGPEDKHKLLLIVPSVLRKEVLICCHDAIYSGHLGMSKTIEKLRQQFIWYKMDADAKLHVKMCNVCNKRKEPNRKPTAPLMDYRSGNPLDRIGLDIMGPLPLTKRKNKYLLVIGDYFTRWMEVYPIPHQNADIIADKLVNEFISRFGIPLEVHTDQGRNFESQLFKEICSLMEATKTRTTGYHPASNGMIERFNRTLAGMIKSFVNVNATNWDQHINLLLAAYRSSIHPATGYSPNFLMLGREINLPQKILFPTPENELRNADEYVLETQTKMEEAYKLARKHLQVYAERQKRDHDSRITNKKYQIGSMVYKLDKTINKKFRSPWVGPYSITKVISPVVYEIKYKNKTEVVHFDRLKPCHSGSAVHDRGQEFH